MVGWGGGWVGGWVAGFYKHITNSAQTEVGAGAELGNTMKTCKEKVTVLTKRFRHLFGPSHGFTYRICKH